MTEHLPPEDSCSTDVTAYALGVLELAEAAAFRRHLKSCAVCPVELAAFEQVVDQLATQVPQRHASRALRRRVLSAVAAEPRIDPYARAERLRLRPARRRLRLPVPALTGGMAALAAVVVAVVIALPGGGTNTRSIAASVTGAGTARLNVSGGHGELVLHHFAAPPHGKIYEVWLQHPGGTTSPSSLFSVRDGVVDVAGSLHGVSHVLVTPEPAGGSKAPTHTPVISATL